MARSTLPSWTPHKLPRGAKPKARRQEYKEGPQARPVGARPVGLKGPAPVALEGREGPSGSSRRQETAPPIVEHRPGARQMSAAQTTGPDGPLLPRARHVRRLARARTATTLRVLRRRRAGRLVKSERRGLDLGAVQGQQRRPASPVSRRRAPAAVPRARPGRRHQSGLRLARHAPRAVQRVRLHDGVPHHGKPALAPRPGAVAAGGSGRGYPARRGPAAADRGPVALARSSWTRASTAASNPSSPARGRLTSCATTAIPRCRPGAQGRAAAEGEAAGAPSDGARSIPRGPLGPGARATLARARQGRHRLPVRRGPHRSDLGHRDGVLLAEPRRFSVGRDRLPPCALRRAEQGPELYIEKLGLDPRWVWRGQAAGAAPCDALPPIEPYAADTAREEARQHTAEAKASSGNGAAPGGSYAGELSTEPPPRAPSYPAIPPLHAYGSTLPSSPPHSSRRGAWSSRICTPMSPCSPGRHRENHPVSLRGRAYRAR